MMPDYNIELFFDLQKGFNNDKMTDRQCADL